MRDKHQEQKKKNSFKLRKDDGGKKEVISILDFLLMEERVLTCRPLSIWNRLLMKSVEVQAFK